MVVFGSGHEDGCPGTVPAQLRLTLKDHAANRLEGIDIFGLADDNLHAHTSRPAERIAGFRLVPANNACGGLDLNM